MPGPQQELHSRGNSGSVNASEDCFVMEGRRVVEISHLASQLQCQSCGTDIHLRNVVKEARYGLGSVLHIVCQAEDCKYTARVTTGKQHPVVSSSIFDVNTKLAISKIKKNHSVLSILWFYSIAPQKNHKVCSFLLKSVLQQSIFLFINHMWNFVLYLMEQKNMPLFVLTFWDI